MLSIVSTFLVAALITALGAQSAMAADGPIALPISEQNFLLTLAEANSKLGPAVKREFGAERVFRATGDWKKEWSPSNAGGSFYHPEIPGVEYKNRWGVHITGWVARWPGYDSDSIGFVLCHELGHHVFGGEGEVEADHFAPKCLRWLWSEADNREWRTAKQESLNPSVRESCLELDSGSEKDFCLRVLTAYRSSEALRTGIWKKLDIMKDDEIIETHACRRKSVLHGILGRSVPSCRK